jgi:hypothetical protein
MNRTAHTPFQFYTRLTLTVLTGRSVATLGELLQGLRDVPESVIYQHTHQFLFSHHFLVPEPPNDFGHWVAYMLGEEDLGERLASVDVVRFKSLAELRNALIFTIEKSSARIDRDRRVPEGKEFHFLGALRFSIPTSHQAYTLAEFLDSLRKVAISSLYLHVFEARLRPPLGKNDFSLWFEQELHLSRLADAVALLDPYTQTLEGLRKKIIALVEEEMSHGAA